MEEEGSDVVTEDRLALLLLDAADGNSPERLAAFYREFLTATLIVPERAQDNKLTHQPEYPNEFLNILGVQKGDTVFVPLFSSADRMREWSGHDLRTRTLNLTEVINLLPAGWWLILNPASEGEKDFSPWELDLLRGGEQSIAALVEEILVEDVIEDIELLPIAADEFSELKNQIITLAKQIPEVEKLFLLREKGKTISEKEISAIMLGILISSQDTEMREQIQEQFSNLGALVLIGAEKLKVRAGISLEGNLLLGIFQGQQPLYQKEPKSWLGRLLKRSPLDRN